MPGVHQRTRLDRADHRHDNRNDNNCSDGSEDDEGDDGSDLEDEEEEDEEDEEDEDWREGPPDDPAKGVWPQSLRYFQQHRGRQKRIQELASLPTPQLRWMLQNGLPGADTGYAMFEAVKLGKHNNAKALVRAGAPRMHNWALTVENHELQVMRWFLEFPGLINPARRLQRPAHWMYASDLIPLCAMLCRENFANLHKPIVDEIVQKMLEQRADPNAYPTPIPGRAPRAPLSYRMSPRCVELLLAAGADPDFGAVYGLRPLFVHMHDPDCLELLLKAGAKVEDGWNFRRSYKGRSLLCAAIHAEVPMRSVAAYRHADIASPD